MEDVIFPTTWERSEYLRMLITTSRSFVPVIVRSVLAMVIFPHGAQKALGWFNGYGLEGTLTFFTDTMGLPALVGVLVVLVEFFAPLALVAGVFGRVAAISIFGLMLGIIATSHLDHGFFMNWTGKQGGEGFEFHILVMGMALAVMIGGSGRYSVDRLLMKRRG
jgi:putative oxidoreductase